MSDNKFIKSQVKDAMKHNKLLEVALNKMNRQSDAIRQFLKQNKKYKSKQMAITAGEDRPKEEVFITSAGAGIQNEVIKEESRGQIGTIERTQYDLEDYKDRMATEFQAEDGGIRASQMEGSQQEEEYLANLNIVKSNADKSVQYQIKRAQQEEDDRQTKGFGAGLPQT